MHPAKKERLSKERYPADFCPAKDCLWRVRTRDGVKPCPKHGDKLAGLAPETVKLMDDLVEALREDQGAVPVLTGGELELIRAKVAADDVDDLDVGALLDHIDYVTDAYEQIVQRSAQEAESARTVAMEKDEQIDNAMALVAALVDPDPCSFDHHGYCQTHNLAPRSCPHEQAKDALAAHKMGMIIAAPAAGAER